MKKNTLILSTVLSTILLSGSLIAKADYTTDDLNKLTNYLHNRTTLNESEFNYYDINADNKVNIYDMTLMKKELYWAYGDIVDSGEISNNNYWYLRPMLRQDGFCLEICGNGDLPDYKDIAAQSKYAGYVKSEVITRYTTDIPFIKINNGITHIGDFNFHGIQALKIDIPDSVETIGSYAFMYSTPYALTLPDSVHNVGIWAFCNNDKTKDLVLSDNLEELNYFSFSGLHNAKRIYIPKSVKSINSKTFSDYDLDKCGTEFWYGGTKEQWYEICPDSLLGYTVHFNAKKGDWSVE